MRSPAARHSASDTPAVGCRAPAGLLRRGADSAMAPGGSAPGCRHHDGAPLSRSRLGLRARRCGRIGPEPPARRAVRRRGGATRIADRRRDRSLRSRYTRGPRCSRHCSRSNRAPRRTSRSHRRAAVPGGTRQSRARNRPAATSRRATSRRATRRRRSSRGNPTRRGIHHNRRSQRYAPDSRPGIRRRPRGPHKRRRIRHRRRGRMRAVVSAVGAGVGVAARTARIVAARGRRVVRRSR